MSVGVLAECVAEEMNVHTRVSGLFVVVVFSFAIIITLGHQSIYPGQTCTCKVTRVCSVSTNGASE